LKDVKYLAVAKCLGKSVIFGLTGPCYVSLTTPIAATLYGTQSLATLTGLLNMASLPGMEAIMVNYLLSRAKRSCIGALSGPPIGGYILKASGRNWRILAGYSGAVQFAGVLCILYGKLLCLVLKTNVTEYTYSPI
jgi:hypothetical protein